MNDTRGYLDLLLLAALAEGSAHGYLVIQRVRGRSGGVFDYPEGSVYPALHHLEAAGLVTAEWETASGRRRKTYELTTKGRRALVAEAADWRRLAVAVESVLGGLS
jgi:PadR family transcriptional regulator, regulatory protein PadR